MRYVLSLLFLCTAQASAQVGHAPEHSPYRDLRYRNSWTAILGHFGGDGGKLGIGPHNGSSYGLRFDRRMSGFAQIEVMATYSTLERLIVDADDSVATRVKGPASQSVVMAEVGLQFNLTGPKTWHGLAPYLGGGVGLAIASKTPQDTSGFNFGSKLFVSPNVGVRLFLTDRFSLRFEARWHLWKLKYPAAYELEPADEAGGTPVITDGKLSQWAKGGWYIVGLVFSF